MASPDGADTDSELPTDVVEDLLSDPRRRYALETLSRRETPMVVDDLAAAVRARETGVAPDAVGKDERRRVREDFFQRHLPKLTATDVVRYDSLLGTVELTALESFREELEDRRREP